MAAEEAAEAAEIEAAALTEAAAGSTEDQESPEKCTRLHVLSAERNAKFHSSQQKASQSTAEIASDQKGSSKHSIVIVFF